MSWLGERIMPPRAGRNTGCDPGYVEIDKVIARGTRLSDLLMLLGQEYPELGAQIAIGQEGQPPLAVVTVNGRIASGGGEMMVELKEGDVVGLLPVFMGG